MTEGSPFRLGDQVHERELDLHGIRVPREAQPAGQTPNVSIDRDTGSIEGIAEDDVRSLTAHTGQRNQLIESGRNLSPVSLDDGSAARADVAGLVPEKPGGFDQLLELVLIRFGEVARAAIPCEEPRRDHVHSRVGALCREDGGDQQLEWV